MSEATSVSIIVPTFRRPDALRDTLASLLALDYDRRRYEVIVVDDDADESTAQIVRELEPGDAEFTLEAQHRRGAASARNRGARRASGELLLFCDDDMILKPSYLRLHMSTRERHGDAVVSGAWDFAPQVLAALRATPFGRYRISLEHSFQTGARGKPVDGDPGCLRMPLLAANNLALSREQFSEIGGFDEEFPVAGAEDQDFSIRASATGALLLLDTKIRCFHNDNRLTLGDYCAREERSAQTMPFLVRKHPREFGAVPYVRENRPISATDSSSVVAKKLAKAALARGSMLQSLHWLAGMLEAIHAPERLLWRLYRTILGIHLYRGFRCSWSR
jgi:GT2 family glycosyltransferase